MRLCSIWAPCVSCLPLRERHCINTLQHRQRPPDGSVKGGVRDNSDDMPLQGGHTSIAPIADTDVNASSQVPTNGSDTNCISPAANLNSWDNFVDCDSLMRKAYGATLIQSGSCSNTDWHRRWRSVVHHSGNLYVLPGGPVGRRYVDLLTEEVQHLAVGNFPSERVLVFSSVMLHVTEWCSVTEWCLKVLTFDDSWIGVLVSGVLDILIFWFRKPIVVIVG